MKKAYEQNGEYFNNLIYIRRITMTEMKSAWEKAMEKAESWVNQRPKKSNSLSTSPPGTLLRLNFSRRRNTIWMPSWPNIKAAEARQYIIQGAQEIFLRNITLPHNEHDKIVTTKALAGIKILKDNKKQLDVLYDRINNLLSYYDQARQQTFSQFKKNFEAKVQEAAKSLKQRPGAAANLEAQIQQQFQDEWRRSSNELDTQYNKALEEHKEQILKITWNTGLKLQPFRLSDNVHSYPDQEFRFIESGLPLLEMRNSLYPLWKRGIFPLWLYT